MLGEVTVTADGAPIDLGTPKERQLLAVLLVANGTVVPRDRVVEALWPDRRPAKPMSSLRAYLSHLRGALADAGISKDTLVTLEEGYRLQVAPESVDAVRLERAVHHAADSTEPLAQRIGRLDEALALVRGEPLADMPYAEFAQREIQRLDELIAAAHELRAELALDAGQAAAWIPQLTALILRYPYRDRLRAAHMRALARTGRHGEALRSYAEHRGRLVDEMGIEPGPDLRALEAELLAFDAVEASAARGAVTSPDPRDLSGAQRRMATIVVVTTQRTATPGGATPGPAADWERIVAAHGGQVFGSGDDLRAAFGVPVAHGRDPERGVRAGVELASAAPTSTTVAVATGMVTVDDGGEELILDGAPVDLAGRLCRRGGPGDVVVDDLTRRLTERVATFGDGPGPGAYRVRNVGEPESSTTPLLGRDEELGLLRRRFDLAAEGEGQIVVVGGEAGVGKTRLIEALLETVADRHPTVVRLQCSPVHQQTAFHPLASHLRTRDRLPAGADDAVPPAVTASRRLLGDWLRDGERALDVVAPDPDERRRALLRAALLDLVTPTDDGPVVCVIEDVQWIDASTDELVTSLAEAAADESILLVITHRPPTTPSVGERTDATLLRLGGLPRVVTAEIVLYSAGDHELPTDVVVEITGRANGVPLFAEEMAREVVERGAALDSAVPATLHDSLTSRLDRIASARSTVQAAAALGFAFDLDLLVTIADREEARVHADIEQLCDAGIVVRRGAGTETAYRFRHLLLRDIAHESLPVDRRSDLHRRAAHALEARAEGTDPVRLAHHWTEAGDVSRAIDSWLEASRHALALAAVQEAIQSAEHGLALLDEPPPADLEHQEVELRLVLGAALTQLHGPSSDAATRHYSAVLDRGLAATPTQRFRALWGRWYGVCTRGENSLMLPLATQLLKLSDELDDDEIRIQAHHAMWSSLLMAGRFREAVDHVEHGKRLYLSGRHHHLTYDYGGHDPGVCMWSTGGLASWMLGATEDGEADAQEAVELADRLDHAYSQLEASFGPLVIAVLDGAADRLITLTDELHDLVGTGQVPGSAKGYVEGYRAVADLLRGDVTVALARLQRSAAGWRELWGCYGFPLDDGLATALLAGGDVAGALAEVDAILHGWPERAPWWDAELHRRRAAVLGASGRGTAEILDELDIAAGLARDQDAVVFEMRALVDRIGLDPGSIPEVVVRLDELLERLPADHADAVRARAARS